MIIAEIESLMKRDLSKFLDDANVGKNQLENWKNNLEMLILGFSHKRF